jgi:hypothetical protein
MADLKTEMSKVLNAWEQDAQEVQQPKSKGPRMFTATNNVTRATFEYVKSNPKRTHSQICEEMVRRGFKQNSVCSLITQFTKQGMFEKYEDGRYVALTDAYIPLKSPKKNKAEGKRKAKVVKVPRSAGIAALKVVPTTINTSSVATAWDAETVINNIGLKQAHKLFLELQTYFGG